MKKYLKIIISSIFLFSVFLFTSCINSENVNNNDDKNNTIDQNKQYTITYFVNSDLLDTISNSYTVNSTITQENIVQGIFSNTPPSKEGSEYTGEWYLDQNYSTPVAFPYTITKDVNFYLKWSEFDSGTQTPSNSNTYIVNFYVDNAKYSEETVNKNETIIGVNPPVKAGYEFVGWYKDITLTSQFELTTAITSNLNLYAKYTIIKLTVEFLDDNNILSTKTVNYNNVVSSISNPEKIGYEFKGWYTDSTYTTLFNFSTKITSNTKIYAKFDIVNTYTVEFLDDEGNTISNSLIVNENKTAQKPTNPSKEGYRFDNWYTDSTYTTLFNFSTKITANTKIYAKFNLIVYYTVEFLDSEGNEVVNSQTIEENHFAIKPDNPKKDNHIFNGWYTDLEFTDTFEFTNKITSNTKIYAKFTYFELSNTEITIVDYSGYNEGAYIEFFKLANTNCDDYTVSYSLAGSKEETSIDSQLIRENEIMARADILGLTAGTYTIKIKDKNSNITATAENVKVSSHDRSGYAHFNNSNGVGAYNNDGTLKSNAVVVYVNDNNKNTVTATLGGTTYTGLANILKKQANSSNPLVIRIIGRIGAATWNPITYSGSSLQASSIIGANNLALTKKSMAEDVIISSGFNTLNTETASVLIGLTNKVVYSKDEKKGTDEFDSYFNMLDVSSANNVTIEGVGVDAEIFQWGFTWKKCNSIEVRNVTFTDYPEDACSFQGGSNSDVNTYDNYWIHNNVFNRGKNYWDVTYEQDKPAGDGATDFKYCNSITSSYNKFNSCKKTGLVGGDDKNYTRNVTFHHNYYNKVGSRLPLGRQANMHIYNNYYYKCGTAQDIRANAFVLSEANYFEECTNPQKVTSDEDYLYPVIKSYGDYLTGCGESMATVVTNRTASLKGNCKPDGATDYTNFDTNSQLFYYDSVNQKSNVSLLTDAENAKTYCINYSGVLKGEFTTTGSITNNTNSSNNNSSNNESNDNSNSTETNTPITSSSILTFNNFSTGDITSSTTIDGLTINPKATKDCFINSTNENIENTTISKVVYLGGGGSYSELSVNFTTTKMSNITIYYKSSSTSERFINLISSDTTITSTTSVTNTISSSTFTNCEANNYSIGSKSSGIYVYCIIIENIE